MPGLQDAQLSNDPNERRDHNEDVTLSAQSNEQANVQQPPSPVSVSFNSKISCVSSAIYYHIFDPVICLRYCQNLKIFLTFVWRKVFSNWKILLFGQALSLLMASVEAVQSTLHLRCNLSAPAFTFGFVYLCLSFHLIILHRKYRQTLSRSGGEGMSAVVSKAKPIRCTCPWPLFALRTPAWAYLLIALVEVEANYVTVLSLGYTTLTSATALKAMSIPTAMIASRFALGRRYSNLHYVGVAICILGCTLNILQDYKSVARMKGVATTTSATTNIVFADGTKEYPHKVAGDGLAILAGVLLGANDVVQELLVRQMGGETTEYLGMMGWWAMWISVGQAAVLERDHIVALFRPGAQETCSLEVGWWLVRAFVLLAVLSYIFTARFLSISEAAFLNLSMLTGDLWSVLFSIVAQGIVPRPVFYGSLMCIVSGVLLYGAAPSPVQGQPLQPIPSSSNNKWGGDDGTAKETDTERSSSPPSQYV